jgi:hypothetical protein
MSEYLHVEKPFLDQLAALAWTEIDQKQHWGQTTVSAAATLRFVRPEQGERILICRHCYLHPLNQQGSSPGSAGVAAAV